MQAAKKDELDDLQKDDYQVHYEAVVEIDLVILFVLFLVWLVEGRYDGNHS